jgi:hypothetical protein
MGPDHLALDSAKMLGEAATPDCCNLVTRLQYRSQLWRLATANQPGMEPVLAGQELDNHPAFTVTASRHDKP